MKEQKKKDGNWFKRHKILAGVLGVFVLIVIVSMAGGGSSTNKATTSSTSTSSTPAKAQTIAVGQPANDGKFEFTVLSVECGKPNVGSSFTTKAAQGQYCFLNVRVKNIGNEAQSLFSSNQYLLNAGGQKYSADDTATIYNSPDNSSWYSNINPGNTVEGTIVFDLPKDQTPVTAELHDSAFSGGVKVQL